MPPVYKRLDIKGYRVLGCDQIGEAPSIRVSPYRQKPPPCSTCGSSKVRSKGAGNELCALCRQIMGNYVAKNKASILLRTNPENLSEKGRLRLKAIFLRFSAIERLYPLMLVINPGFGAEAPSPGGCFVTASSTQPRV